MRKFVRMCAKTVYVIAITVCGLGLLGQIIIVGGGGKIRIMGGAGYVAFGDSYGFSLWMPDAVPASPSAYDDEFDDSSFDTGLWTEFDQKSNLTVSENSTGLILDATSYATPAWAGIYQSIPAGDFTIEAKIGLTSGCTAEFGYAGILLWEDPANTSADVYTLLTHQESTPKQMAISANRWEDYETATTTLGNAVDVFVGTDLYYRVRRNGTTYSFEISTDGVGWIDLYSGSLTNTPTAFGVGINNNNSGRTIRSICSFVRYRNSDVGFTGIMNGRRINF